LISLYRSAKINLTLTCGSSLFRVFIGEWPSFSYKFNQILIIALGFWAIIDEKKTISLMMVRDSLSVMIDLNEIHVTVDDRAWNDDFTGLGWGDRLAYDN
jgi:hypothetical protein